MRFRIGSAVVELDFSFFVMLALFLMLQPGEQSSWMIAGVVVHELGHLLILWLWGIPVERVAFSCFGINLVWRDAGTVSVLGEAAACLGGPAANLLAAGLLFLLGFSAPGEVQLVMGCFHLLPVGALDGGRAAEVVLRRIGGGKAAKIGELILSAGFLAPILWWGVQLGKQGNFTLLLLGGYLALSLIWEWRGKSLRY